MMNVNQITFAGTATKDGEILDLQKIKMGKFAMSFIKQKKDGTDDITTVGVVAFGDSKIMQDVTDVKKGDNVLVTGSLSVKRWKDKEQHWQTSVDIQATNIFKAVSESLPEPDMLGEDVPF